MTEPMNDDERLAALMDKRLDPRQREELLARLAASEDERYVLADTAAVLRELEAMEAESGPEEDAAPPADVIPLRPRVRGWRSPARWVAVAAVLAGLALIPVLASWWDRYRSPGDPLRLAAALGSEEGLPEGWPERRPWSPPRGEGVSPDATSAERAAQAARAGVLMVDLAVAVGARDTSHVQLLADQARDRFDREAGDDSPFVQIAARAGAPACSLEPLLERAAKRLATQFASEYLELGAWAEASRLAVHRRDAEFLRGRRSRAMLERAERLTVPSSEARAAVTRIRAALDAEGRLDWDVLAGGLDTLLYEIAS